MVKRKYSQFERDYKMTISKVALVTKASKGIGYALFEALVVNGWQVVGVARSLDVLEEMTKRFGVV